MNSIIKNNIAKFAAVLLISAFFSFSYLIFNPTVVSAQSADDICNNKAEESKCRSDYKKCASEDSSREQQSCINSTKGKYAKNVIDECKGKSSSEDCNKKVEDKCKDKRGKQQDDCRKKEAENYVTALSFGSSDGTHQCGTGPNAVKTRINFSCVGNNSPKPISALEDITYAIVRFLSYGVGLVIAGSIIVAGIQYSTSEGNAETTTAAKNRIRDAVIGLVVYIFAFSLLQYLTPGGIFNS